MWEKKMNRKIYAVGKRRKKKTCEKMMIMMFLC